MRQTPLKADPSKVRAWQDRSRKPLARSEFWKTRAGTLRRKTAMAKRNEERIARRRKEYAVHIRSAAWLQVRYERYLLDGGFCQCEWCVDARARSPLYANPADPDRPPQVTVAEAFVQIPVYFTARGVAPWRRIRGFSTHHVRYRTLGEEQLKDLRTMYIHHHDATEAKYSHRRRYLASGK